MQKWKLPALLKVQTQNCQSVTSATFCCFEQVAGAVAEARDNYERRQKFHEKPPSIENLEELFCKRSEMEDGFLETLVCHLLVLPAFGIKSYSLLQHLVS